MLRVYAHVGGLGRISSRPRSRPFCEHIPHPVDGAIASIGLWPMAAAYRSPRAGSTVSL